MPSLLTNIKILTLAFVAFGSLSACFYIYEISDESVKRHWENKNRPNHYDPIISYVSDTFIRVKYLDNNEKAQPEEAMKLIDKHCKGSFTETNRTTTSHGVTIVEAECK